MWGTHPPDAERISCVLSSLQREKIALNDQVGSARRRPAHDARLVTAGVDGTDVVFMTDRELDSASQAHALEGDAASAMECAVPIEKSTALPPKLKPRRGCCFTIIGLWMIVSICGVSLVGMQMYKIHSRDVNEAIAFERRVTRDETISDALVFGTWDSMGKLTPLQLQVSISIALGVRADDWDVHVSQQDNSFFVVRVEHATSEEVDFVNSDAFIADLNKHTLHYGGKCVLSQRAKLVKQNRAHAEQMPPSTHFVREDA
jgi:hypothetical protein